MKRLLLLLYWCAIIILVKVGCPWHCLDVDLLGFLILWLTCLACWFDMAMLLDPLPWYVTAGFRCDWAWQMWDAASPGWGPQWVLSRDPASLMIHLSGWVAPTLKPQTLATSGSETTSMHSHRASHEMSHHWYAQSCTWNSQHSLELHIQNDPFTGTSQHITTTPLTHCSSSHWH